MCSVRYCCQAASRRRLCSEAFAGGASSRSGSASSSRSSSSLSEEGVSSCFSAFSLLRSLGLSLFFLDFFEESSGSLEISADWAGGSTGSLLFFVVAALGLEALTTVGGSLAPSAPQPSCSERAAKLEGFKCPLSLSSLASCVSLSLPGVAGFSEMRHSLASYPRHEGFGAL